MAKELDFVKIEMAMTQRFKELETRIFQVLGLVEPHFQRVIGSMLNEYKGYMLDIVKREVAAAPADAEVPTPKGDKK